jgi:hypothetical protein
MGNLSLTAPCHRGCPEDTAGTPILQPAGFLAALDFLERARVVQLRLLGGEPMLHPDFAWMLTRALERGFSVLVYSGGLIPHAILRKLERLPPEKVTVLVNVAVPGEAPPCDLSRQTLVFSRLGLRALPSLEILSPSLRLDFLLELIDRHGLARGVRLGLAFLGKSGSDVVLPSRPHTEVGRRIVAFAQRARQLGVKVELHRGGRPCLFPPDTLRDMGISPLDVEHSSGPILDILPDGQVIVEQLLPSARPCA